MHIIRGVLEVGQAVSGLDGEDVWLGGLVHARDVERVKVVQRAQERRVLALYHNLSAPTAHKRTRQG